MAACRSLGTLPGRPLVRSFTVVTLPPLSMQSIVLILPGGVSPARGTVVICGSEPLTRWTAPGDTIAGEPALGAVAGPVGLVGAVLALPLPLPATVPLASL